MRAGRARRLERLLAFTSFLALLLLPQPIAAAGWGDGCNPNRTPNDWKTVRWAGYFMWDNDPWAQGFNASTQGVGAVEAQILEYSPWVQPEPASSNGETDAVSAWVMLQTHVLPCATCNYAQAGWMEAPYTERHEFVQWANTKGHIWGFPPNNNTGAIVNNYVNYRVEYNPADKRLRFYMSDQDCSTNPCQAVATVDTTKPALGWTPDVGLVSGETHSKDDQMPGGSGFREDFYWPQIGIQSGGQPYHLAAVTEMVNGREGQNTEGEAGAYEGTPYYSLDPWNAGNLYGLDVFGIWDISCGH